MALNVLVLVILEQANEMKTKIIILALQDCNASMGPDRSTLYTGKDVLSIRKLKIFSRFCRQKDANLLSIRLDHGTFHPRLCGIRIVPRHGETVKSERSGEPGSCTQIHTVRSPWNPSGKPDRPVVQSEQSDETSGKGGVGHAVQDRHCG